MCRTSVFYFITFYLIITYVPILKTGCSHPLLLQPVHNTRFGLTGDGLVLTSVFYLQHIQGQSVDSNRILTRTHFINT